MHQSTKRQTPKKATRQNKIISEQKEKYLKYWNKTATSQSKSALYLTLNRQWQTPWPPWLIDNKGKWWQYPDWETQPGHRNRQSRLPSKNRQCSLWYKREVEIESHFLLYCKIWEGFFFFDKTDNIYTLVLSMSLIHRICPIYVGRKANVQYKLQNMLTVG